MPEDKRQISERRWTDGQMGASALRKTRIFFILIVLKTRRHNADDRGDTMVNGGGCDDRDKQRLSANM